MKVMLVSNAPALADGRETVASLRLLADSTVGRVNEPLFYPDHLGVEWQAVVAPAIRIGRLGTNIHLRHAEGYIDAVAAALLLAPAGGCSEAVDRCSMMLDRAIIPGAFVPVEPGALTITVTDCDGSVRAEYPDLTSRAVAALCALSKFGTVRTGDLLVLTDAAVPVRVSEGLEVSASIGDGPVTLNVRVR